MVGVFLGSIGVSPGCWCHFGFTLVWFFVSGILVSLWCHFNFGPGFWCHFDVALTLARDFGVTLVSFCCVIIGGGAGRFFLFWPGILVSLYFG